MTKQIIYVPIEVEVRELLSKIHIAIRAAKSGHRVVIGQKSILNKLLNYLEKGIYLSGGAFSNYFSFFKRIKSKGFKILVIEEEGLITYKKKMYLDMRTDQKSIDLVERYYLWGRHQYEMMLSEYKFFHKKFLIAGNPRFDILNKKNKSIYIDEINLIKRRFSKFCLICTCFSSINHFDSQIDYLEILKSRKTLRTKESIKNFIAYQEVKKKTLKEFLIFIEIFAQNNSKINIVIRPHPGESNNPYKLLSKKYKNVFVNKEFSVHPWLIASEFLVHHYCTTSIEALALGTPSYSIRPKAFVKGEYEFPFACSNCFKSGKLLAENLLEKNIYKKMIKKSTYKKYVNNIDKYNSSKIIVDDIDKYFKNFKEDGNLSFLNKIRNLFKKFFVYLMSNFYEFRRSSYERNKLKKINKQIIGNYIDKIEGKHSNKKYKIHDIGFNLVQIERINN